MGRESIGPPISIPLSPSAAPAGCLSVACPDYGADGAGCIFPLFALRQPVRTIPTGFPGSFFKMADTLIGPGDEIHLPTLKEAQKTTAEAELGVIMGKDCRDVSEENWQDAIVGYTTILDMTEESILKGNDYVSGNPRYLCIVKNFPTFFSFGPELVTPDEVPDVLKLEVQSVHNGEIYAKNVVANMTHRPARLVSLHSSIQGWYAGDILSTGTPRAFHIQDGDMAECRIVGPDGFEMRPLLNPVVDLKKHPEQE